jgi:hypothetical protein
MSIRVLTALVVVLTWLPSFARGEEAENPASGLTPAEVFEQRIMPIFKSPEPASCVQCHLSSVDLKDYILPSHEQTFASLRDQGLIDLDEPGKSKVLTLIGMGEKDLDKGARLIHEKTRRAEYEAFASWIAACASDPRLRELPRLPADELARPDSPDEVIRHARKSRVIDSFVRNVWSQRMRCFPCHTPHELDESNPKLRPAIERHKKFIEEIGEEYAARMDIFRESPAATVQSLIEKSRAAPAGTLPLINLENPAKSLLVLKPTAKLPAKNRERGLEPPSSVEPVTHLGGLKMHVDDQSYKSFVAWIEDYARIVGGEYTSVAELPRDDWYASKSMIMLREAPEAWPEGARVQLFIHAWDAGKSAWSDEPVAFTQGVVTPVRNVAGSLFLFGSTNRDRAQPLDPENAKLAPGRFLLKAYLDSNARLADDPTALLGKDEYFGQAEINAHWEEGFPKAEKISGRLLK